jgi:hypothetical protein
MTEDFHLVHLPSATAYVRAEKRTMNPEARI